jgi:hypothetical protein
MKQIEVIGHSLRRLFVILMGVCGLFFFLTTPAHALEVSLASIQSGQVHVVGKDAPSNASIFWQGVQVATATKGGTFNFKTPDVPLTCVGELAAGMATLFIAVNGCTASEIIAPEILALVPATGQTTSFAAGDDGDLEKGVVWPVPRFTDNGDGTITDHLTGLIWLKNANCPAGARNWQQALDFVAGINDGTNNCGDTSNAGFNQIDWRLPNLRELQSLVDYGRFNPSLPLGHPFSNFQASNYWSSTTNAFLTSFAWFVLFDFGDVNFSGKSNSGFVIAVRVGS